MKISKELLDAIRIDSARRAADKNGGLIAISGTIRSWDASKGRGWIKPDQALPHVLLYIVCVKAAGIDAVKTGDWIECECLVRQKGLRAYKILKHRPV